MPKQKRYVVWKGKKTGIFSSWQECQPLVQGFTGAQYKSFSSKELADHAFAQGYTAVAGQDSRVLAYDFLTLDEDKEKPLLPSLSVDAACAGNPGIMEYRGVWTETGEEIFRKGPFDDATVNVGEFLALVHMLALCQKNNWTYPIYSDSLTAMTWVKKKKTQTQLGRTSRNHDVFAALVRAESRLVSHLFVNEILKWQTQIWGEIPADFGRK